MAKNKKTKEPIQLNIDETKDFLRHIISNNRIIQQQGKVPVSVEVIGESGIGKTSTIIQLAEELNLNFVKLNLAQIEELGDLVGFPIRQFEMVRTVINEANEKETTSTWIDEHAFDESLKLGFESTGNNRMSYCAPEWISGKTKGGILLLDDWNRADIRFIQAVMELIDRQTYISWSLPKDWHIVLTANPDTGDYLVNSIDNAQKTRFISTALKFDKDCWAKWAESSKIDGRCINFVLMNPELLTGDVNSRSAVMFFNSISSIPNFEDKLPLIQMIGEGSTGSEFSIMFTLFINNKLDKIIAPDKIFTEESDNVIKILSSLVKKGKDYRADIASTIATRISNYCEFFAKENTVNVDMIKRISTIVNSEIFQTDICYNMVKNIYNSNPVKFKPMMLDKKLIEYIVK